MPEKKQAKTRDTGGTAANNAPAPEASKNNNKCTENTTKNANKPRKRKPPSIFKPQKFKAMAQQYGVDNNPLFLSTLDTYAIQLAVIQSIKQAMQDSEPTVEKSYVQGKTNIYIHPAVKELPRHMDSANKTATLLVNIIKGLGAAPNGDAGDEFDDF